MSNLNLYRRHVPECPHAAKGIGYTKCSCPIWVYGETDDGVLRRSLKTRDWARANRRLPSLLANNARPPKPIKEAVADFLESCRDLAQSTKLKYESMLRLFTAELERYGLKDVPQVGLEHIDSYHASRKISPLTWSKELQLLRHFFHFCVDRDWTLKNPAKLSAAPKNLKPTPKEPYTLEEVARIVAACDTMGRYPYERMRARAMVLLLRYTAMRISDVALLGRDRVVNGKILVRAQKTGEPVFLPVPADMEFALSVLPVPKGTEGESRYYFWNGVMSQRTVIGGAKRTMTAVFEKSGVAGAHAHRFRHTLATEILERGGSIEDAADILGNSPAIIRKHYAKWSKGRQDRVFGLLQAMWPSQNCTIPVQAVKPAPKPMEKDSLDWCGRRDYLYVVWARYAHGPLTALEGTLLLSWFLRAMGMEIGRRVVLGPGFAQVVDPDMLRIDDGATVTTMFQAHTFEDRVLKIDHIHIGRRATLGAASVPLYGADVGEGAYVAPHSVIMKQEHLLPGRRYEGAPARQN